MKNLFKIFGAIVFVAFLFFSVSLSGKSNSNDITLSSLTKINEANAECEPWMPWSPSGRCIAGGQYCVFSTPPDKGCDPTIP